MSALKRAGAPAKHNHQQLWLWAPAQGRGDNLFAAYPFQNALNCPAETSRTAGRSRGEDGGKLWECSASVIEIRPLTSAASASTKFGVIQDGAPVIARGTLA